MAFALVAETVVTEEKAKLHVDPPEVCEALHPAGVTSLEAMVSVNTAYPDSGLVTWT
jgi:hypothetical protein